ncbi:MAG: methyltransferase domain-containing protein [Clostridia bacterium]|nr:methyltransferase domain-containing protein [Clostridia bacterium]
MNIYETEVQKIIINDELNGSILDIGGGGEGIIGLAFGERVTAIDNRQDELDESPAICTKMLMDAADLKFEENTFDTVTSFFTMMYIDKSQRKSVLSEIHRVLKPSGRLVIWDAVIPENTGNYDAFVIQLNITFPNHEVNTGYGVRYIEQDADYYLELLDRAGFISAQLETSDNTFKITAYKKG